MAASVSCCPGRPSCNAFTLQANKSLDRAHRSFEPARLPDILPTSLAPVSMEGFADHLDHLDLAVHVGHYHIDTLDLVGAGASCIVAGWVCAPCRVRRHAVVGWVWRHMSCCSSSAAVCEAPSLIASAAGCVVVPYCQLQQQRA